MHTDDLASILEHPLALGSFRNWIRLILTSNGFSRQYLGRILSVSLLTLLASPLRVYERMRFSRLIVQTQIDPEPIFIVGHWRTGTTHLHHLICQDDRYGYVSTFQALAPDLYLVGRNSLKPVIAKIAKRFHPTRLIDNIPLSMDAPQEEEFAIANLSPYSFLHAYTLPQQALYLFEKYVLLQNLSNAELSDWRDTFLSILKKASISSSIKPLVLKNPVNSGRIGTLLNLFPKARFIHIVRNPYNVFRSTMGAFQTVLPKAQIQQISTNQIADLVITVYTRLMKKYLQDRRLIPIGNLVEIRFEDLELEPMTQIHNIYDSLNLPGFQRAERNMREYLNSISNYQKNGYKLNKDDIDCVNHHWEFAFRNWGYEQIDSHTTTAL